MRAYLSPEGAEAVRKAIEEHRKELAALRMQRPFRDLGRTPQRAAPPAVEPSPLLQRGDAR